MRLGVNIDHVATLREARGGLEPEPAFAALLAEDSGADSIVAHLREDRRHINDTDLRILKEITRTKLNLEMSVSKEIVDIACRVKPGQATLVPEKRKELTTEGGLDIINNFRRVKLTVRKLEGAGIDASLFIDPDKGQISASRETGVMMIELHTGRYANAKNKEEEDKHFKEMKAAAQFARSLGLNVFAGHGLNYNNASRIAGIGEIEELNIGHSIIARAVFVGLGRAVKEMKELIS
ncbi:MAG: pyridoxine 5'-phosphate synthase [Candidatus Omnitrophica bacterium]|nr:pyridoxine 5'-phosphate synthase [Candidatus Omnitrophota bacterium]